MEIQNSIFKANDWQIDGEPLEADIVFTFGETESIKQASTYDKLKKLYPSASIVGCSSSGNVMGSEVSGADAVASAVQFSSAKIQTSIVDFETNDDLESLSLQLINQLEQSADLKHIFVLSDGLNINGSELVKGINKVASVPVTGGLSGDGDRFAETWVIANDAAKQKRLVAIGFYGESLNVSSGCFGGWTSFGTFRTITKSEANVVYEIDGEPALDLYKTYLGEAAERLPSAGLRFPLSIRKDDKDTEVIRTLLAVDEEKKSITFAGDVPEGYSARLMKTDIDKLIDGAGFAAENIQQSNQKSALCLVVSCVGRKLVLSQLVDEELEAVEEELGNQAQLIGFYSYGEIAPFKEEIVHSCQLHNQTMTLTAVFED